MSAFVAAAAALIAVAIAFVAAPLLRRPAASRGSRAQANVDIYRDQLRELETDLQAGTLAQDQYERSRREIEARLLQDVDASTAPGPAAATPAPARRSRIAAVALAICVPVAAAAVYLTVGNPGALVAARGDEGHGLTPQQFEGLVARLAARLKEHPEDAEGWTMLGRSYAVLGRFREASDAYANAAARQPQDSQLLADYADALAMAQGRRLDGEPEKIIARALALDPENVKANMLAGTVAFNKGDYAKATAHWERVLVRVPPDSELAQQVRGAIADARGAGTGGTTPPSAQPRATAAGRVRGTVTLAPALAAKAKPEDTVFVFARAAQGPRMPLAIVRKQVRDLPFEFTLDDSMAMSPAMKLSGQKQVIVGARVSKSGNATPQPGDLEGSTRPVAVGSDRLRVVIDAEVR
ncbi:MAG TPA: c-type cytochrome biogenesis protein CcmI [Burkholderiales bacterium]|nr:c-type cytochrome biogenesis protein CcmI [Burkholderiales bacterium]